MKMVFTVAAVCLLALGFAELNASTKHGSILSEYGFRSDLQ